MAGNLGELTVRLGIDSSGLTGGLRTAASALSGFAGSAPGLLGGVGIAVAAATAITVGLGIASVKMAGDWQQSMTLLINSAGESQQNIQMVSDGLLQMAVDTGTSTDQLAKGMFNVESAGYHGSQALQIEAAAARGARVENSDLAATTDVLTTSMHNYHLPASQAVDVMNSFRMAASMGKMHMDDLSQAMKNVLPIASQAGVSLTDVEAAVATMSLAGDKGAAAGTHLTQMLTYLLSPSSKATKALKSVGLTTQEISDEMKVSLPGTVDMITKAVGEKFPVGSAKYIAALSAIVGGNKSMKAMLELSGQSLKDFTNDANALGPTMKANSTEVDGFALVQTNFNFKMDAAKAAVEALAIKVGTALLPFLGTLVSKGTDLIVGFTQWETKTHGVENALGLLGQGFNLVGIGIQKVVSIGAGMSSWIGQVIASFQGATNACRGFSPAIAETHTILAAIGGFLTSTFTPVWKQLVDTFNSQLKPAWNDLVKAIQPLMPELQVVGEFIGGVIVVVLVLLVGVIAGVVKACAGLLSGVIVAFGGIVTIISGALQVVTGVMAFFADLFTGKWSKLGNDVMTIVGGWGRIFSGIWDVIRGVFMAGIGAVVGFVTGFFGTVIGIFHHLADVLVGHSIIPDMINAIVKWFLDLGPRGLSAVNSFISFVKGALTNFAGAAVQLGANIIGGVISGIKSMIGNVGSAMGSVVSVIDSFLPHSPAKNGPLSQLNSYGPALVHGIATGIDNSHGVIEASVQHMVQPMAYPIKPSAFAVASATNTPTQSQASNTQGQTIILQLDSVELARINNTTTDRLVRLKLGNRSIRAA